MNDKKFTIQLLSNYQQRCFVEFLTEWKKEHEEEYLSFRDDLESNTSGDFSVYAKLFEMAVERIPANILVMCKELFGAEVLPFEIDDKKREIQFPPTLNYTKLGRRAGNGWDVNLVGILLNHIFWQLL